MTEEVWSNVQNVPSGITMNALIWILTRVKQANSYVFIASDTDLNIVSFLLTVLNFKRSLISMVYVGFSVQTIPMNLDDDYALYPDESGIYSAA